MKCWTEEGIELRRRKKRLSSTAERVLAGNMEDIKTILLTLVSVSFCGFCLYLYCVVWERPERIREKLRRQGIRGSSPSFFYGNGKEMKRSLSAEAAAVLENKPGGHVSHEYYPLMFPYFEKWRKEYGPIFMYTTIGSMPVLYVTQPEMVKEMNLCTSLDLGRPSYHQRDTRALFGQGIISSNGLAWAHQRKLIASELFMDRVKGTVDLMVASALLLLKSWGSKIEEEKGIADLKIDEDMRSLSADIISKACFGSSYLKGQCIFQKIRTLQTTMSLHNGIPSLRYLPTNTNKIVWRLETEIDSLILKVVKERRDGAATRLEGDLLQSILKEAKSNNMPAHMADKFIVDNCKNIYFAGHETTAIAATWTLLLLALNPEWQDRAREEVTNVCGAQHPDVDMLKRMKTLTMVIRESMRLYPPAIFVSREAFQEMVFGGICIPKGFTIWISIAELQHDPEIWGPDSHEFRPERFAEGVSNACKHPHAYMPFGLGIRTCLGLNFAMAELKVVLSLLLSEFTFSLSPKYVHEPTFKMFMEPRNGVNLLVRRF